MRREILLSSLVVLGFAVQARGADSGNTGWVRGDPEGADSADNPASVDRIAFGNSFQNQGLDQWCDSLPFTIPISQDVVIGQGVSEYLTGGTFNANRQFFRYPNGEVSINDQLELKVDMGYAMGWVSYVEDRAIGFFFGASIDGQSLVTRPMHGSDSCKNVKRFYNPLDFKTVLPLSAKRLGQMDVGELWIIPMTFQISFEPLDVGYAPTPQGHFKKMPTASYLSLGASKTSDPTITVFRVGPKEMRLKLHLDQVKAVNAQLGLVAGPIPATDIGTPGIETLLNRILPNTLSPTVQLVSRQIDSILGAIFNISASKTSGQQVLLQYTLDPSDPKQMESLAKVIHGDLSALRAIKLFATVWNQDASSPGMIKDLDALRTAHDKALHRAADLNGIDDYRTHSKSLNLSFPVAFTFSAGTVWTQDHYVTQFPQARDVISFKVERQSNLGLISLPLFGSYIDAGHAAGAQVLVDDSDAAGAAKGKLFVVYTEEWGVLRKKRSIVNRALEQADSLLGSIGTDAAASALTRLPKELRNSAHAEHYHKGYLDLSIVFGPQAVQDFVSASTEAVERAFSETLDANKLALWDFILKNGQRDDSGVVLIRRDALGAMHEYVYDSEEERDDLVWRAKNLCRRAALLVRNLRAAGLSDQVAERRAQSLFRLVSGKGGVSRGDFKRIALRLVPTRDISGDVLLHLDTTKTSSANYTVRFILHPALFADEALKGMGIVERGFIAPTPASPLND